MLHKKPKWQKGKTSSKHQEGTDRSAVLESLAGLVETEPVSPVFLVGEPSASGSSTSVSRNKPRERTSRSTSGANTGTETDKRSLCSDMSLSEEGVFSQSRLSQTRRKGKKPSGSSNSGNSAPELTSMIKGMETRTWSSTDHWPLRWFAKAKERIAVTDRELIQIEAEKEAAEIASFFRTK